MTNKERLISLCGFEPGNNSLEGVLIDSGIDGSATYDLTFSIPLKKAARELILLLFSTADNVNENGFGIKYDRATLLKRLELLDQELGLTEDLPTITGRHVW